jgi:hypothetical protein
VSFHRFQGSSFSLSPLTPLLHKLRPSSRTQERPRQLDANPPRGHDHQLPNRLPGHNPAPSPRAD